MRFRGSGLVSTRTFRRLTIVLSLAVTVGCSYLAVRKVHLYELGSALRGTDYRWLAPALAALVLGVFLRGVRWRFLYRSERRPPLRPLMRALLVGYFFNNLLPARAGEAARIEALHRETGASRPETLSTVVAERIYDVASLILMLVAVGSFVPHVERLHSMEIAAGAAIGIAAGAVVLMLMAREWALRHFVRLLGRLRLLGPARATRALTFGIDGLASVLRPRVAAGAFCWTIASWLPLALSNWLVLLAFHLHLSPLAGLLVSITTGLGMALPASPGSVGVYEVAAVAALSAYGVSPSIALSYALVLHVLNFLPYIAAGAVVLSGQLARRERPPMTVTEPAR